MNTARLIGLAALLTAGAVAAQGRAGARLDANGDGVVTLDEFKAAHQAAVERRFAALDTDHDGNLTQAELDAGRQHAFGRRGIGARIDKDGDGAWSFAELQAVRPDLTVEDFNKLDKNGDGLITADERPHRHHGVRPTATHDATK